MNRTTLVVILLSLGLLLGLSMSLLSASPSCRDWLGVLDKKVKSLELDVLQKNPIAWKSILDIKYDLGEAVKVCQ